MYSQVHTPVPRQVSCAEWALGPSTRLTSALLKVSRSTRGDNKAGVDRTNLNLYDPNCKVLVISMFTQVESEIISRLV